MLASMETTFHHAIPVLPAADVAASIRWWVEICGFREVFRHGDPAAYAGLERGAVRLHLTSVDDAALARTIGEQTMVRFAVAGLDALHAEFQARGGQVHPNGPLRHQPWGGRAFDAIDPGGVCVTFTEG
jgi:catechol 2,3-dioxygenase-like lactoylglutathione lyase family enzyme